jgi:hypothetical protein
MTLALRQLSMDDDREEMLGLLRRNFGASQDTRFEWRHTKHPAGRAWSWFAYDRKSLATVAMTTVFPRNMYVDGKPTVAGQVGEFAVNPDFRCLGPAVMLQRATFEPVDRGLIDFCYDCPPHDQGMSTFRRLGMAANTEVFRYAYVLDSQEYFEKRLGKKAYVKPISAAANILLRMRTPRKKSREVVISSYRRAFCEEFTELDASLAGPGVIRASRSAADLNWRYREDPLASVCLPTGTWGHYEVLVARRAGELVAFAVFFLQSDRIASLVDLFGHDIGDTGLDLLDAAIHVCRREGMSSFQATCSGDSALKAVLLNAGFRRRESNSRVVAYAGKSGFETQLFTRQKWAFSKVEVML